MLQMFAMSAPKDHLNRLARGGNIQENASVKAALEITVNASPDKVWGLPTGRGQDVQLWGFPRNNVWRHICSVMRAAEIEGAHATPKGLRHGFGIKAVTSGVPLNTLQQLLSHAQLSTILIYADIMGAEKGQLVERMWG